MSLIITSQTQHPRIFVLLNYIHLSYKGNKRRQNTEITFTYQEQVFSKNNDSKTLEVCKKWYNMTFILLCMGTRCV